MTFTPYTNAGSGPAQGLTPPTPIEPTAVLPDGVTKYDVLRLVRRLRKPLGLNETAYAVLETLADPTRADDWQNDYRQPINHQRQCDMALRLGLDARSFRRAEACLERLNLISKNVPLNGDRSALTAYSLGQAAYGISLQPLIDRYEELKSLDANLERERETISYLQMQVAIYRRKIGKQIDEETNLEPSDPLYLDYVAFRQSWPHRPSDMRDIPSLSKHLDDLKEYSNSLVDKVSRSTSHRTDMSCASDKNDPRLLQTIRTHKVICSDKSQIRPDDKSSDDNNSKPTPNGSGNCLENNDAEPVSHINPHLLEMLTPDVLKELVTPEWNFYVDSLKTPNAPALWEDFEVAAVHMLYEMGISASAYEEAVAEMGRIDALVSLIVINRNQTHPTRPVHNPGGALRAFSRKHKAGMLNLQASIFGLLHREKIQ